MVARFARNDEGRDFVVGDIHGMFNHLAAVLTELGFEPGRDRLFSVGDLVDRGPQSRDALEWLNKPWFFACRGNHEQFVIDSEDPELRDDWVESNGGGWWLTINEQERQQFRRTFLNLPLVMEVETNTGMVGIVHADVPPVQRWEQFITLMEAGESNALLYALWSRNRIQSVGSAASAINGVERVYCGHTPTQRTVVVGNVYYIDTGAAYSLEGYEEAALTVVEIQPERHREYNILTAWTL